MKKKTVKEKTVKDQGLKGKFGLISLILAVVSLVISLFVTWDSYVWDIVFMAVSVVAIVLGFMGIKPLKKAKKSIAVAVIGIVVGFLGVGFLLLDIYLGYVYEVLLPNPEYNAEVCKLEYTFGCVDDGNNETSTCQYGDETDSLEIVCKNDNLKEEQYK